MTVCLCCPACGSDVPEPSLSKFVRYYSGDMGSAVCPQCKATVEWQMRLRAKRRLAVDQASGSVE